MDVRIAVSGIDIARKSGVMLRKIFGKNVSSGKVGYGLVSRNDVI